MRYCPSMRLAVNPLLVFFFALLASGQLPKSGQTVRVRLVDVRSGRYFPNESLTMQFNVAEAAQPQRIEAKTEADGTALFILPSPTPEWITVFSTNESLLPCYSLAPLETQKVLREGISRCTKPGTNAKRQAEGCGCRLTKQV